MRQAFPLIAALFLAGCSGSSTAPSTTTTLPVTTPPAVTPPVIIAPPPTHAPAGADFDLGFYREFVHNGFEQPSALVPLQRLPAAPMLYLKTVDEAGKPIDGTTLQTVEDAMRGVAAIWGGGRFGLAGVVRGTDTKNGVGGWLTVRWSNPSQGDICGRSEIGADGGVIDLNYLTTNASCKCNGSQVRPRTARHELGHAFGYYHTDSQADVMRNGALGCDALPSDREVYHATIAYQSAVGSVDHVQAFAQRSASPIVIVD